MKEFKRGEIVGHKGTVWLHDSIMKRREIRSDLSYNRFVASFPKSQQWTVGIVNAVTRQHTHLINMF